MPQLDKYLVFVETFWFIVFFSLSYIIIYYFLVYLIKSMRLRESFAMQLLISNIALKNEKLLLNSFLLNTVELKLLNEKKLKKVLPVGNKIQKKAIVLNFSEFNSDLLEKFNNVIIGEENSSNIIQKGDVKNINKSAMELLLLPTFLMLDTKVVKEKI